jgi:hypothetical protein
MFGIISILVILFVLAAVTKKVATKFSLPFYKCFGTVACWILGGFLILFLKKNESIYWDTWALIFALPFLIYVCYKIIGNVLKWSSKTLAE